MRVESKPKVHNSYKVSLLFKCNRKKNPHDSYSTFYGLPMFVIFSVHVCAYVEGWMVENASFMTHLCTCYQYADCAKAQYEPTMHTKRCMLYLLGCPKKNFLPV